MTRRQLAPEAVRQIGPLNVRVETAAAAVRAIVGAVISKQPLRVAFANTHLLYYALRDETYAEALQDFYLVNDGIGLAILARLASHGGFTDNLNGTDLTPRILAALPFGARVMMVGARPEIIHRAATHILRTWPHLEICGTFDGYASRSRALIELPDLKPDVVLVAMGNPMQELWIAGAARAWPSAVFLGVGALFDFFSGAVRRAPPAARRLRLEWAYRLALEPNRLWRRYTLELFTVVTLLGRARRTS